MNLPSKTLLRKILQYKNIIDIKCYEDNKIIYYSRHKYSIQQKSINIYYLMYKCKEWALKNGYALSSGFTDHITQIIFATVTNDCFNTYETFNEDTEFEAIIAACEWILKELKK